ncbi:MAG: hypothetical protein V2I97_20170 [Desulfococcaceae bacterium]|jgi:hypothetical protein|nr:hypothetical protein [Desulfococcaceae bacterium]
MIIDKSYITDEDGNIISVVLDYEMYKKIEELILDSGLLKAMEDVEDEETPDYSEVQDLVRQL